MKNGFAGFGGDGCGRFQVDDGNCGWLSYAFIFAKYLVLWRSLRDHGSFRCFGTYAVGDLTPRKVVIVERSTLLGTLLGILGGGRSLLYDYCS